jgi:A/G-specific adenine glycosylase
MSLPAHFDDAAWRRSLARKLLAWFDRSARDLPWRRSRDLYRIWVSEIMLQQTQVATVTAYFERFVDTFPDVHALARADEEQVMRRWAGLGYYRRARQMHAAAKRIVSDHAGEFPRSYEAVRGLPGIGRYTAGAILSIGLDARLPILEANSIRVLARLAGYRGDVSSTAGQKLLWQAAEQVLPKSRSGAFNQSLMELGSGVCTPRAPKCEQCPIAELCVTRELGLQDVVPAPKRKPVFEELTYVAVVVHSGEQVLVRRCQPGERWAGLWDFARFVLDPDVDEQNLEQHLADQVLSLTGVKTAIGEQFATLKHGVTRFKITLKCFEATCASRSKNRVDPEQMRWVSPAELSDLPLSTTARKIAKLVQASMSSA